MQPDAAFMAAVRGVLVRELAGLVSPAAIRAGGVRPDAFPAVVLTMPSVSINGHAAGSQLVAELNQMLHVWTRDNDAETAQLIGTKVMRALMDAPKGEGIWFDRWERPALVWVADPKNEALHGAVSLSAVVRWKAEA